MSVDKFIGFDSDEFKELRKQLEQAMIDAQEVRDNHRPGIAEERYLTGEEILDYLHISPRTLQNLRDNRMICFTTLCGKILYPESELMKVLKENSSDIEFPF